MLISPAGSELVDRFGAPVRPGPLPDGTPGPGAYETRPAIGRQWVRRAPANWGGLDAGRRRVGSGLTPHCTPRSNLAAARDPAMESPAILPAGRTVP